MSRRTRIYLSGPIVGDGSGNWRDNIRVLQRTGMELRKIGYAPFVPAAGPASAIGRGMSADDWMECDYPYVQIADAVLRLSGESQGADLEEAYAKERDIPVYYSIESLVEGEPTRRYGDARFHDLLQSIGRLHDRKQNDYGTSTDPFANVRASEKFGVKPWVGAMIRLHDKVTRLQNFAVKDQLANESAIDSMMDIAVYALIAKVLYEEEV